MQMQEEDIPTKQLEIHGQRVIYFNKILFSF